MNLVFENMKPGNPSDGNPSDSGNQSRRWPQSGLIPVRISLFMLFLCLVALAAYYLSREKAKTVLCTKNLDRIYMALEMYEIDRGTLPSLAFFPDDPQQDSDSLLVILKKYGIQNEVCICPSLPRILRDVGLTYVWNVRLNGRKLLEPGVRDWMLVEINALSEQVVAPHLGGYNVLYTDGKVERTRQLPPDIRVP